MEKRQTPAIEQDAGFSQANGTINPLPDHPAIIVYHPDSLFQTARQLVVKIENLNPLDMSTIENVRITFTASQQHTLHFRFISITHSIASMV